VTTTTTRRQGFDRLPAPVLLMGGMVSVQIGSAWADTIFNRIGAGGATMLRLAWAAVILLAVYRPAFRGRGREEWLPVILLGLVLAAMNLTFYHAVDRLPLGIAVTVEFIGPLAVAVGYSHRPRDLIWLALAVVGIVSLAHGDSRHLSSLGLVLAAVAGCLWGCYIPLQARLGRAFSDGSGLALAMLVATIVAIPDGVIEGGSGLLRPGMLAVGLGVGVLSSVVPYSVELAALRRMSPGVFGVMMSLEPATAALVGAVILSQGLSVREIIGMALVSAASVGATVVGRGSSPAPLPIDP
jgi:inner membrane transporter RhtA